MNAPVKRQRRKPAALGRVSPTPARIFTQHGFGSRVEFTNGVPMVYMTREAFSRMYHIVDIVDDEVGFLGTVSRTPQGNFLIEEIFVLEQEVTGATTEISEDGIAALAQELIETREDGVEVANNIRFWGHSHVRMGTSASHQDDKQMELFKNNGCPWFVRGILNKLGRMEFTIYFFEEGIEIADAKWAIYEFIDDQHRDEIEADIKAKVTKKTYRISSQTPLGDDEGTDWMNGQGFPVRASVHSLEGFSLFDNSSQFGGTEGDENDR